MSMDMMGSSMSPLFGSVHIGVLCALALVLVALVVVGVLGATGRLGRHKEPSVITLLSIATTADGTVPQYLSSATNVPCAGALGAYFAADRAECARELKMERLVSAWKHGTEPFFLVTVQVADAAVVSALVYKGSDTDLRQMVLSCFGHMKPGHRTWVGVDNIQFDVVTEYGHGRIPVTAQDAAEPVDEHDSAIDAQSATEPAPAPAPAPVFASAPAPALAPAPAPEDAAEAAGDAATVSLLAARRARAVSQGPARAHLLGGARAPPPAAPGKQGMTPGQSAGGSCRIRAQGTSTGTRPRLSTAGTSPLLARAGIDARAHAGARASAGAGAGAGAGARTGAGAEAHAVVRSPSTGAQTGLVLSHVSSNPGAPNPGASNPGSPMPGSPLPPSPAPTHAPAPSPASGLRSRVQTAVAPAPASVSGHGPSHGPSATSRPSGTVAGQAPNPAARQFIPGGLKTGTRLAAARDVKAEPRLNAPEFRAPRADRGFRFKAVPRAQSSR
jgi:hypothetical protein